MAPTGGVARLLECDRYGSIVMETEKKTDSYVRNALTLIGLVFLALLMASIGVVMLTVT